MSTISRQLFANAAIARRLVALLPPRGPGLCQPRIPEDRKERSASAVGKRIGPALAIVDDESLDGHGLIACAVMPTAAWLTSVAVQNRITRSCAVSGNVVFMIQPSYRASSIGST